MKPWLFDILACPIDKHFPLKLFIFKFETPPIVFESILNSYIQSDLDNIKSEKVIRIFEENKNTYFKDNIILEKNSIDNYLTLIISSINELANIVDKSPSKISEKCFNLIRTQVNSRICNFLKDPDLERIDEILPDLYFVNKIKIETEIESGILFCEKCHRWFPIIDTIPQMLPDEYRDEDKEIQFLKNNKNLMDEKFFTQDLKPFSIK